MTEDTALTAAGRRVDPEAPWILVERFVERYPDDWRLLFKRANQVVELSVSEDVWRLFDSVPAHQPDTSEGD